MQGFQLSFFTQQNHQYKNQSVGEWILKEAHAFGIRGATLFQGGQGFGHHHRIHSAHFFELADQPIEVTMVVTGQEMEKFMACIKATGLKIFYVKIPVDFGTING